MCLLAYACLRGVFVHTVQCAYTVCEPTCLHVFPQLGDYISDIASNMMLVEEHILWMAQNEARACTRIVQCVERIADLALTGDNQVISKVKLDLATLTVRAKVDYLTKCLVALPFLLQLRIMRS